MFVIRSSLFVRLKGTFANDSLGIHTKYSLFVPRRVSSNSIGKCLVGYQTGLMRSISYKVQIRFLRINSLSLNFDLKLLLIEQINIYDKKSISIN